jgi:hypothetical protein
VKRIEQAGVGGYVVEHSTVTRRDGSIEERERVEPPDWRSDAWALERLDPGTFGQRRTLDATLTLKHVDALADGLLGVIRQWGPTNRLEEIAAEIGRVIERRARSSADPIHGTCAPVMSPSRL